MKLKTLVLNRSCTLFRVTVRCPHGESVDFEFPTPGKSSDASERRRTLAHVIRSNRHAWKLIEQGKSIFGRCARCTQHNQPTTD